MVAAAALTLWPHAQGHPGQPTVTAPPERLYAPACPPLAALRLLPDGTPVRPTGEAPAPCVAGMAFDAAGLVHVVPTDRIRVVADGGVVQRLDGTVADPRRTPGLRALLVSPAAVGVGRDGTVYVGSRAATRVARLDASGRVRPLPGVSAGPPARVDDPARPAVLAVDDDLSACFADPGTASVYRVAPDGHVTTAAGTGTTGSAGDGGPAVRSELDDPRAVALDPEGRLYVTEGAGRRVRRLDVDGTLRTVAGTGRAGTDGDGGPAAAATFLSPGDVGVDPAGDLYVVDLAARVVRRVTPDGRIATLATG